MSPNVNILIIHAVTEFMIILYHDEIDVQYGNRRHCPNSACLLHLNGFLYCEF